METGMNFHGHKTIFKRSGAKMPSLLHFLILIDFF
jgi:hypothetical protein